MQAPDHLHIIPFVVTRQAFCFCRILPGRAIQTLQHYTKHLRIGKSPLHTDNRVTPNAQPPELQRASLNLFTRKKYFSKDWTTIKTILKDQFECQLKSKKQKRSRIENEITYSKKPKRFCIFCSRRAEGGMFYKRL